MCYCFFFFKQKTAYEMRISDWSSDVCSSDLIANARWGAGIDDDVDAAAVDAGVGEDQAAGAVARGDDDRVAIADQPPRVATARQYVDLFAPEIDEQAPILEHVDADQPRRADMPPCKGGRVEGGQAEIGHVERGDAEARRQRRAGADRRHPQLFAPPEIEAIGQFARDDRPLGAGVDEEGKGSQIG